MRLDHLLSKETGYRTTVKCFEENIQLLSRNGDYPRSEFWWGMDVMLFNLEGAHRCEPGDPFKARRSGFEWERRRGEVSELSRKGGSERYGACGDEGP